MNRRQFTAGAGNPASGQGSGFAPGNRPGGKLASDMKALLAATLLLSGIPALAQAAQVHTSALGFAYNVPSDWQVMDLSATLPGVKEQAQQNASSDMEKQGASCVNLALTARHGAPASVMVIVELPFDCLGQVATEKDLPGFAQGASEGLKQNFDLNAPVFGSYALGAHNFWIERATGSPKGHAEMSYTVEIACTLLKKGAVCWMTMAADAAALKVFEDGAVTLEGDKAAALVPGTAFANKPN